MEHNRGGAYNASVVKARLDELMRTIGFPDGSFEQRMAEADCLLGEKKQLKSEVKDMLSANHISEAIEYYRIFKSRGCGLKVTVQVDPNLDNGGGDIFKEDGLVEVLKDYDARYNQNFTLSTYQAFKRDVALRLAHKDQYAQVHKTPDQEIDLLIVVDQMLTGFDSKWVNTLYFDRVKKNEAIIQSFSRTNRLFGPQKPFGNIRYYRKCHTMEKNIDNAFRLFSGDRPRGLFVDKLPDNIKAMVDCRIADDP